MSTSKPDNSKKDERQESLPTQKQEYDFFFSFFSAKGLLSGKDLDDLTAIIRERSGQTDDQQQEPKNVKEQASDATITEPLTDEVICDIYAGDIRKWVCALTNDGGTPAVPQWHMLKFLEVVSRAKDTDAIDMIVAIAREAVYIGSREHVVAMKEYIAQILSDGE